MVVDPPEGSMMWRIRDALMGLKIWAIPVDDGPSQIGWRIRTGDLVHALRRVGHDEAAEKFRDFGGGMRSFFDTPFRCCYALP